MRAAGGAALVALGLLLVGCTGAPSPSVTAPVAAEGCPAGTSASEGFCLSDDPIAHDLLDVVRTTFAADQLGAVIAGVWHDGDPVLVGAIGDSVTGEPATPDMHHVLGNLATPMYATVVLQQVEAGVISLTDKLSEWLPDIPGSDEVTLDMLLHDTSGYAQFTEQPGFLQKLYEDPFQHWETADVISYGVGDGPTYTPGTDWNFSDTNTLIMTEVVEKATGRKFADLLQEGVFEPLGMTDTYSALNAAWPEPVLHGYSSERGVWEDVTTWNPSWAAFAGGLGSNQEDVRRFLDALGTGELLSPELHEAQLAPTLAGIGFNTPEQYWGMGTLVLGNWIFMNPGLSGYFGAGGTLPSEGWTMVVYNTTGRLGDQTKPSATDIFRQFTAIVSPENSLETQG